MYKVNLILKNKIKKKTKLKETKKTKVLFQ